MQLTQKIVCEHRNTQFNSKNDARRPVKNLILISRVLSLGLGLVTQVLGPWSWPWDPGPWPWPWP